MAKTFNSDLHWVNEGRDVKEKGHKGGGTLYQHYLLDQKACLFLVK